MSDVLDDLGNVVSDLGSMMGNAVEGDYHAAAGAVDWALGDQAGADAQWAAMHDSGEAASAALDQAGQDLDQAFKDGGFNVSDLGTGPTIELD